jgi:hypothetical protein
VKINGMEGQGESAGEALASRMGEQRVSSRLEQPLLTDSVEKVPPRFLPMKER